ncbi:Hypothetical predicted protein, partial [Paramuricea clavata]
MENGRVDLSSEKLAKSLSSFVESDDSRHCELNIESSLNAVNILYSHFCYKKNKLKWAGSLEDLKAVVLTVVDEQTAETTTWRSPSGGMWKFDSKALCVTWQKKSQNIYFEGENGKEVTKRIISHLNQGVHASLKAYSLESKATEAEPSVIELISDSCRQNNKQLNEDCREITIENGDAMNENADISSADLAEANSCCASCIKQSEEIDQLKAEIVCLKKSVKSSEYMQINRLQNDNSSLIKTVEMLTKQLINLNTVDANIDPSSQVSKEPAPK